jgi:hypothetical protein
MFVFGYVTHKTFYFMRTVRLSIMVVKMAQVIYLTSLIKSLEHMSYARELVLESLIKSEKGATQISIFEKKYDDDVKHFKTKAINTLIHAHPQFFLSMLEFDDWAGAMKYLQTNKKAAIEFWREFSSDK